MLGARASPTGRASSSASSAPSATTSTPDERDGAKGFPRFTDPRLRAEPGYAAYLRMAAERSLERCGIDHFDLLLLHNPDRIGYTSETVWAAWRRCETQG